MLRHFEGLELTEVAFASGLSLATVKRRLEAAQEKLVELVAADALLGAYLDAATHLPDAPGDGT